MKQSKNFNNITEGEEYDITNPNAFINSFTGEQMTQMVEQSSFYIHIGAYYGAFDGSILLKGNDSELVEILNFIKEKYPKVVELNPELLNIKIN